MDKLLDAIKEISLETRRPAEVVIAALSDYGVISQEQDVRLNEQIKEGA